MNRELPEPEGFSVDTLFTEIRSMAENYSKGAACPLTEWWDRDQVLAIQKQAYEDGLRDADKDAEHLRVALENLCDAADATNYPLHGPSWDRLWNNAVAARKVLSAMLTASQKG